jgi:hypothetical protein
MQSPEGIKECAFCNEKDYSARKRSKLPLDFQMDESTTSGILVLSPVSGSSGMESMVDREHISSQLSPRNSESVEATIPYTSPLAQLWYMPIPKDLDISDEQAVLEFIANSKRTLTGEPAESMASMHDEENSAFMSSRSVGSEDQQENLTDREHFASPVAYYRSPVGRTLAPTTPTFSNIALTSYSTNSKLKGFLDEALSPFPSQGYRDRESYHRTQSDIASSPPDSPGTAAGVLTFSTWDGRDPISEVDSNDDTESVVGDEDDDDSDLVLKFDHSLSLEDANSPNGSFARGSTRHQLARHFYSMSEPIPCTACGQLLRQDEIIDDALCTNPKCSLFMIPTEMTGLFKKETRSDVSSFVPNTPYGRIEDLFALDFESHFRNITTPAHKISTKLLERQLKQVEESIREERDDEITRHSVNETTRMAARSSTEGSETSDSEMQELYDKLQAAAKALKSLEKGVLDTDGFTTSSTS